MRGYLNIAGKNAKANVKLTDELNPQLLVSRDLDAFAVTRTFERALNEGNIPLVGSLKEANKDLLPYFKFIERSYIRDHANTKVDQLEAAV